MILDCDGLIMTIYKQIGNNSSHLCTKHVHTCSKFCGEVVNAEKLVTKHILSVENVVGIFDSGTLCTKIPSI